ncbi:MAG: hypothetical protein ACK5TN_18790 [Acidobacteriota bacterium]|jgi:uncharacterized protein YneF (UPF0154 family)
MARKHFQKMLALNPDLDAKSVKTMMGSFEKALAASCARKG